MTDYGRGSGSEPWHPDDPLFGDAYDQGQGYPQQQPPHPQAQGGDWQDPYATGQHQQQYPQHEYPQHEQYPQQHDTGQYQQQAPQPPQQQYGTGQYPQQQPQHPQHPQQQYPPQQQPGQQPRQPQHPQQYPQQAGYDGYDTGGHQVPGYGQQDPYGGRPPQDPYGGGGQQPGYYGQDGYPQQGPQQPLQQPQQPQFGGQPQPQGQQPPPGRQAPGQQAPGQHAPGQQTPGQPFQGGPQQGAPQHPQPGTGHPEEPGTGPLRTAPGNTGEWEPDDEGDPREHAFFAGQDEDDDAPEAPATGAAGGRRAGKNQPKGGKKRRSGCACLVVLAVLGGGLAGGVYYGYGVYQDHFGPAPDYSGNGSGSVQVTIPRGSTLTAMGNILKEAGVVKSVDAFTSAARKNPKGESIQAGVYLMNKQMSAAAAVTMMLDPKSQNAMIVSEGMRDKQIYALIDKRLDLKAGTTENVAHTQVKNLGLPDWAQTGKKIKDPLEGFLFPSRYSVAKGMKPEELLRQMVNQAKAQYTELDLAGEAKKQGLDGPYQLLTVASLVQAEGKSDDDFRKMAKVVYNRLRPDNKQGTNQLLQFDSTYNYIKNASETKIATKDVYSLKDDYNTYVTKGLTPGPIGNPGITALKAAMNPDPGPWYFFISLDDKTTQFTETYAEFNKIKSQQKS